MNTKKIKSINYVLTFFPSLRPYLLPNAKQKISTLTEAEKTFLALCKFFQNPKENNFDYQLVYLNLKEEEVIIANKALSIFSKEDYYLISKPTILHTSSCYKYSV